MNLKIQLHRLILFSARGGRGSVFIIFFIIFFTGALFANAGNCLAQIQLPEPPLPLDPRPLSQLVSESEKSSLADAQAHGSKRLVETYLKFSDTYLQAAFNSISANNYVAAERELDIYNKAMAAAGKETFDLKEGKRSLSKRIEQTLYRQIKTLESIERLFPSEREAFAEAALKHAKQLRVQALNAAFASEGVLKDTEEKHNDEQPIKEPAIKKGPGSPLVNFRIVALSAGHEGPIARVGWQVPGDYLTEEEDDHVREAQAADARVKVFMKIADRRIKAITGQGAPVDKPVDKPTDKPAAKPPDKKDQKDQKKIEEEEREWGALPKASRAELLRHYAKAIAECMAKLEDAYERNPKSASLPKALTQLRDATDRHLLALRALTSEMKNDNESAALREAVEEAETANKGARDGLKRP